ncbi:hypothetical protein QN357_09020, partial [Cryobacterium sp. RTC2.1]|uniref:hypothetical protein n=1 Tax=Cryobacterium sp. RTC2.1 TaxID=3048634 RepID=UPI002B232F7C
MNDQDSTALQGPGVQEAAPHRPGVSGPGVSGPGAAGIAGFLARHRTAAWVTAAAVAFALLGSGR